MRLRDAGEDPGRHGSSTRRRIYQARGAQEAIPRVSVDVMLAAAAIMG